MMAADESLHALMEAAAAGSVGTKPLRLDVIDGGGGSATWRDGAERLQLGPPSKTSGDAFLGFRRHGPPEVRKKMRTGLGLKEGIDLMDLGLMEMGSFNDWTWV